MANEELQLSGLAVAIAAEEKIRARRRDHACLYLEGDEVVECMACDIEALIELLDFERGASSSFGAKLNQALTRNWRTNPDGSPNWPMIASALATEIARGKTSDGTPRP